MTKKLALFCDGTWNDLRMADHTNVARLAKCVAPCADSGTRQIVYYDDGVGVASNISRLTDLLVQIWGGAIGRGLDRKIEDAYRFLVLNFEPEDDVYVFGFSRGAYTARSLCGLIRKCGILRREHFDMVPEAMALYRGMKHPRDPAMVDFRRAYAHPLAAGPEDHRHLGIGGGSDRRPPETLEDLYQYRPERSYRMMYVGLWDTVGSLGVPDRFRLLQFLNKQYRFHDTDASSLLASVRHAVSIDEDRRVFGSTPVANTDELNQEWADATGWNVADPMDPRFVAYEYRPYQQRWFAGDHGAVGGGNPEPGLSSHTLRWIAEGAARAGLAMIVDDPGNELGRARVLENACADWRVNKDGTRRKPSQKDLLGEIGGFRPRPGPSQLDEVGDFAFERWRRDPFYRPANLSVLKGRPGPARARPPRPHGFPPAVSFAGRSATFLDLELFRFPVPARPQWVATPVEVKAGDLLTFTASGTWVDFYIPCSADGFAAPLFYLLKKPPRIDDKDRYFRLMGRIVAPDDPPAADDPSATFPIGRRGAHIAERPGLLYVFANDRAGHYWNNWGQVHLRVQRRRR